jgi:predicted nucleotidyltransferase
MEQFPRDALCDWAGTTPEIVALYVCGSHAQGTARPDLDLAVEVKELRSMTGIPVKDLELIEVSKSVKDPIEIYRRYDLSV